MARAMPVISISKPQEHEQRHRQQNEVAHALVHAADQHHQRRVRGQRQIAVGRQPEPEGDRHAGEDAEACDADKEDDQVDIAERTQPRLRQPEHRNHGRDRQHRGQHGPAIACPHQPQQRKQRHQANTDRQRRRPPDVGDFQRRRGDEAFFVGVFAGRPGDQQQERQRGCGCDQIEISPHRRLGAGDDRRHPHVLGTAECHRRAQHGQPQEQDRRQFVRPDQRPVQRVARHHAGEQDDDFGDHQERCRDLDQRSQPGFKRSRERAAARGHRLAGRRHGAFGLSHHHPLRRLLTTACRRTSPAAPRPARRICPSTRNRTRPSEVFRGTAPPGAD